MTVEIKTYHLPPTPRLPNSPHPLLHYKNALPTTTTTTPDQRKQCHPTTVHRLFTKNNWPISWIIRYAQTQPAHYHSRVHECMAVLSGTATIRFGAADTSPDLQENTYGGKHEEGGVELQAEAGDVFVIPAGVAHKTHNTQPEAGFAFLTPGGGKGPIRNFVGEGEVEGVVAGVKLDGFVMMGAYEVGKGEWDFVTGLEGEEQDDREGVDFERVWGAEVPRLDPVFGGEGGLLEFWK